MRSIDRVKRDLVIANRILAHLDVLDTSGHVSHRHPADPERFLMSRSLSPALVTLDDILELSLECKPTGGDQRSLSVERFIHGAVYEARPDVQPRNAQAQMLAMQLGVIKPLSAGEVAAHQGFDPDSPAIRRGWEYYARMAGVGDLLMD
jgi:ribulose-5-phosphate 4-epimerase/fuculose-1-phosphate aldolase